MKKGGKMEKQPTIRGRRLELLIPEEEIKRRIRELAEEIEKSFPPEEELLIVGLLKGSFIFVSDLVREIKRPVLVDFISASSYSGTESSGNVEIKKD
ncbi:MAG: hypoxanthine phosphoribosyltransferase, partial [Aquificaceae bacterium]